MRYFWIVFFLVFSVGSNAQMKSEKVSFKGKTYNLYPVRFDYGSVYRGYHANQKYILRSKREIKQLQRSTSWDLEINSNGSVETEHPFAYNPFPLPDGEYLAYYKKLYFKVKKKGKYLVPVYRHMDTVRVAATFQIVDNKLHGEVKWYDFYNSDLVTQTGQFVHGVKEGEWHITSYNKQLNYRYTNNNLNGPYSITRKDKLNETGNLANGDFINKEYYNYKGKKYKSILFDSGKVVYKHLYYPQNGRTKYIDNQTDTATFDFIYFNKKGQLTRLTRKLPDEGYYSTKNFYPTGQLRKECLSSPDSISFLNREQHFLAYWFADNIDQLNKRFIILNKTYFKDGTVHSDFDVRRNGPEVMTRVDKKGNVTRHIYYENDVLVLEDFFGSKHRKKEYFFKSEYRYDKFKTENFKKGELVGLNIDLDDTKYFNDSLGFIRTSFYKRRKYDLS